ncbi:STAS domain-containing protein [Streptomyces xylophagus]|uniref:STAS domain-containing protein n=1 Tax=Streptomyces xylophagus TaxID=285514 RepID=UPI000B168EDD|nr:STAS domain-containing protein [Streptomyces xylophagus]
MTRSPGAACTDLRALPPLVHVSRQRGYTILALHGEIDIAAAQHIAPRLDEATHGPAPQIVIDLSPAEFFDASGLRLLCHARRRIHERAGRLLLVCPTPRIRKVMLSAGLIGLFHLSPALDEALPS